jgi:Flagellar hook-length control protein FliK
MQVPLTDAVITSPVPTGGGIIARVVAGNVASVPIGALLQATVTSVKPREATLTVNGQEFTVQAPPGLRQGAVVLVRVPPSTAGGPNPTLELEIPAQGLPRGGANRVATGLPDEVSRATTAATPPATRPVAEGAKQGTPVAIPARAAVVDVLEGLPDGRVRVAIEGVEQVATSARPLVPGERYVLQVERTPTGVTLKPAPETPQLPTEVATAVLRTPSQPLPTALKPLQAELTALVQQQPNGEPVPPTVRDAAGAVRATLQALVPNDPRPLRPAELQQLVENGGLHHEAKLARQVAPSEPEAARGEAKPTGLLAAQRSPGENAPDLKGDLLRLLQTVQDLGGAARVPAAQAALSGIESQQAANVLAQASGQPYVLQVPFPDGGVWKTLNLALEPQNQPDRPDADRAGRFRLFMHVPLTDLGETWIDAGLAGDRFRATIYLDQSGVRDRVRAALPELRSELQSDGFTEVLLDVRAASELPDRRRRESVAMQAGRPESVSVLDVRV